MKYRNTVLQLTSSKVDGHKSPSFISEACLEPQWQCQIECARSQEMGTATNTAIALHGIVSHSLQMETCKFRFGSELS